MSCVTDSNQPLESCPVDVEEEDIHPITLMELHSLAFQFEQEELKLAVRRRFRYLLSQEAWASLHTVDLRNEMARHNMLEIVHLVKVEPHPLLSVFPSLVGLQYRL